MRGWIRGRAGRALAVGAAVVGAALLALPAAPVSAATAPSWRAVATAATTTDPVNMLNTVDCATASSCMAVGVAQHNAVFSADGSGAGRPLAQLWNGRSWRALHPTTPAGTYSSGLNGVACPSTSLCIAVGYQRKTAGADNRPLVETWRNGVWTVSPAPSTGAYPGGVLMAISCPTATGCTLAGLVFSNSAEVPMTAASVTGGWRTETLAPVASPSWFNDISCAEPGVCMATGGRYTTVDNVGVDQPVGQYRNGKDWVVATPPEVSGSHGGDGIAVSCVAAICAVTENDYAGSLQQPTYEQALDIYRAGRYTEYANPGGRAESIDSVSCSSATECTLVGFTGSYQTMFARIWNGTGVRDELFPTHAGGSQPDSVSCLSATSCVAVGLDVSDSVGTHASPFSDIRT